MKFLLVLLVVVLGLWLLLRGRGASKPPADAPKNPGASPGKSEDMVACTRCGLHLPMGDALPDSRGRLYCGAEHRDAGPA